jgi:hypothetical protein
LSDANNISSPEQVPRTKGRDGEIDVDAPLFVIKPMTMTGSESFIAAILRRSWTDRRVLGGKYPEAPLIAHRDAPEKAKGCAMERAAE